MSGPSKLEQKLYGSLFPSSITPASTPSSSSSRPVKRQKNDQNSFVSRKNQEEDLGTTQLEDDQVSEKFTALGQNRGTRRAKGEGSNGA